MSVIPVRHHFVPLIFVQRSLPIRLFFSFCWHVVAFSTSANSKGTGTYKSACANRPNQRPTHNGDLGFLKPTGSFRFYRTFSTTLSGRTVG